MKKNIKVLHVIGSMNRGGAEAMIMNYYRSIDHTKVQFSFVENCEDRSAFDDEIESMGGEIYHCPHFNGKNYYQYRTWWRRFFKEHSGEYQIVHGHIGSCAAIYLGEAKKSGAYTIAHSHSSGTDHSLRAILYQIASYNTRNIADYFFACSAEAGVDRYGKKVVKSERYKVIYNAVDTNLYRKNDLERKNIRKQFGIGDDEIVIGHVGRFSAVKNHHFLLEIFEHIYKKYPATKLLLVGGGELDQVIREKAAERGLADQVIFAGIRADVNRMIQAMDVFVFPSIYEGLPVTLVEVQTAGVPCVISDCIPKESILVKGLVDVMPLSESAESWAERALKRAKEPHWETQQQIKEKGFDIVENAKWLEKYYIEAAAKRT